MKSASIPAPQAPAAMPVDDDLKIRAARTAELAKIGNSSGREATILTGRGGVLGDAGSAPAAPAASVGVLGDDTAKTSATLG